MVRRWIGLFAAIPVVVLLSLPGAHAQTLTSITINGAPSSLSTGAFATLSVTGAYSDGSTKPNLVVQWSSSNGLFASVSNNGVVTGKSGTVNPVTITATSGSVSATAQITVIPQTQLFASDGSNLTVYDITGFGTTGVFPGVPVTTINYYTQQGGGNGLNPIPMVLGPGPKSTEQYLFIANPGYLTDQAADFVVAVIDTTTYQKVAQISSGLCYPTSLAVASHYLYVVNAGPSVAQSTSVNCSGANVQYYDITQMSTSPWNPVGTLTTTNLTGTTGAPLSVPLVVGASSDQADGLVYVGSAGNGYLTAVQTGSNTVTLIQNLTSGTLSNGYSISPQGLTVTTAYPSWASAPVHTVFVFGRGYDTVPPSSVTEGSFFAYLSDSCQNPTAAYCSTMVPQLNYPNVEPFYVPVAMGKSSDGLTVYAVNQSYFLDSFASADGTSSSGFGLSWTYTSLGTNTGGGPTGACTSSSPSPCLPVTGLTTTADASQVVASFAAQPFQSAEIVDLVPTLQSLGSSPTVNSFLSLLASQSPEIHLNLTQAGTNVSGSFDVHGNFQNTFINKSTGYPFACNWGETNVNASNLWSASVQIGPTGGTVNPNPPTYSSGPSSVPITPIAKADANNNTSSIINPVSVGPVTTQISAAASTVPLGSTDQFTVQVGNATDQIVTWQIDGTGCSSVGSSCPYGSFDASGLYSAPGVLPSSQSVQVTAVPNADTTDATAVSNAVTLTLTVPPTASLSASSLSFGTQNVGTTSAAKSVTVSNTGQANLVLGATPVTISDPTDYTITANTTCTANLSIAPNGSCVVYVTLNPTTSGSLPAILTVSDNSGGTAGATQTVSLSGTGQVPVGTASLSASSLTFAAQNVGTTSAAQSVTLTNTGTGNLVLAATPETLTGANPGDYAIASGTSCTAGLSIAPNGTCVVNVTFTPTGSGTRTANLLLTDNSGGTAGTTQTVTLTGTGQVPVGTASLSTSSLTFAGQNVGTTSAAQSVTLTNTGTGNLVLATTPVTLTGANPGDYTIATGTTCTANLSISPNGTCVVKVTFTPIASGTRTANVVLTDNSGGTSGTTQTVTLNGTGQQPGTPAASLNPSSLAFGTQNVGTTSAPKPVTVTNTGQANLVLANSPVAFSDAADYAITSSTTCTANLSIAPNGSCVIDVTFTPTSAGSFPALMILTDNSGGTAGTTQTLGLSGTGQTPVGTANLSTSSLTFATQIVGTMSAAQSVTVANTGAGSLVLAATPATLSGTNPGDFAIASGTTCTASLSIAPNGTCVVNLTFTPTAPGSRNANLVLTDNSGGTSGATQTVTLSGTGQVPAGTSSLSTSSLTFAAQNVGTTSAAQSVTLTNTGTGSLILATTPVTLTGTNAGDYTIASGTTCTANLTIAPNGTCVVNVTFAPTVSGTRTANLVLSDNSGGTLGATQTVTLSGTGQQAVTISLYPATPDIEAGASEQFTANFQPASSSGTVNWSVSGTACGGHACGTINSSGLYSVSSSVAAVAVDTVTAVLASNSTVSGSTQVHIYLKPTLSTTQQAQTVTAGQSATYNLTLAGGSGDGLKTLAVECHQNTLPTGVSCPPVQIQPGTAPVNFTFTVTTTGSQGAALMPRFFFVANLTFLLPLSILGFVPKRRRITSNLRLAQLFVLTLALIALGGCGTSGSSTQPPPKTFNVTPSGTYTIQLDGVGPSGVPEKIGTIQLVVN